MTGIAALVDENGIVWMGGDSAAVGDGHYLERVATPKVFRKGSLLIGYTSSFRMGHALQHRLVIPPLPASFNSAADVDKWMAVDFADAVRLTMSECGYMRKNCDREEGGVFLVGIAGCLYVFDDDYHAHRPLDRFAACGAGVSVILGSLFTTSIFEAEPEARLRCALSAAEQFVTSVCQPFHIVSLPIDAAPQIKPVREGTD